MNCPHRSHEPLAPAPWDPGNGGGVHETPAKPLKDMSETGAAEYIFQGAE